MDEQKNHALKMRGKEILFVAGAIALVYFLVGAKAPGASVPASLRVTSDKSVWRDPLTNPANWDTSQPLSEVPSIAPLVYDWSTGRYAGHSQASVLARKLNKNK